MSIPPKGYFSSYSGAQILPVIRVPGEGPVAIGEIQAISYSTHSEVRPVRALGSRRVRGFSRGPRTVAGTLIFTVFDRDIVRKLAPKTAPGILFDEMPPFDVTVVATSETGQKSRLAILGIRVVDEGRVMAIDDLLTEHTVSYIAEDIIPLSRENEELYLVPDVPERPKVPEAEEPKQAVSSHLEVTVHAEDSPAVGAKINVKTPSGKELASGKTDSSGTAKISVPHEGDADVSVYWGGKQAPPQRVVVSEAKPQKVSVTLPKPPDTVTVSGKVYSGYFRSSLAGAKITLTVSSKTYSGVTDQTGKFSIKVPKGLLTQISITEPNHKSLLESPGNGKISLSKDIDLGEFELDIVEAKKPLIRGRVVSSHNKEPIRNASVVLEFEGNKTYKQLTQSNGTWVAKSVPPTGFIGVTYSASGHKTKSVAYDPKKVLYGEHNLGQVELELAEVPEQPSLKTPTRSFRGTVKDAGTNKVIQFCKVTAFCRVANAKVVEVASVTDSYGSYIISYPANAEIEKLRFEASGYKAKELPYPYDFYSVYCWTLDVELEKE